MAREVTISVWCDNCMTREERRPGSGHSVQLDSAHGEIDLCDQCWEQLAGSLQRLVQTAAQPAGTKEKKETVRDRTPVNCPTCQKELSSRNAVVGHMLRKHNQVLAEWEAGIGYNIEGRKLAIWCVECGAGYADQRGIAGHISTTGHSKGTTAKNPSTEAPTLV